MSHAWYWPALFLLGCYHGINPGMGWLFAVALGLQDKSRRAVFLALPPITLGHLVSVFCIVALAALLQQTVPAQALRYGAAAILMAFGLYRAIRARHPRWVGMRVGFQDLVLWAFLMATGHGAGLMLLPFLTGVHGMGGQMHMTGHLPLSPGAAVMSDAATTQSNVGLWLLAVAVHTLGYVLTMIPVAWLVYEKLGLQVLRSAWLNFDLIWAGALVLSGIFMLFT